MGDSEAVTSAKLLLRRLEREGHVGDGHQCPRCMQPRPCRYGDIHAVVTDLVAYVTGRRRG